MAKRDPKVKQEAGKKLVTKTCKPTKYTAEFVAQETENMLNEVKADPKIVLMGQLFENRDYSQQRCRRIYEGKMMVKQGITANGQADF